MGGSKYHYERAIIGPPAKRHSNIECKGVMSGSKYHYERAIIGPPAKAILTLNAGFV